ncbi:MULTISPECIES: inorganic diphosphatase [Hymenobacter]|jgi:inorganic pyrophosphatase|uniref:Inorganic pyrophosphatase n=2 Tax=Hymenobacter TaxID=89966 RepID=A0A328BBL7_9BACT|nr:MULTISPECIES: inorganic diphosphatase [Hymenobacter]RAK64055.1 inorganic diphosphatase [Hymenobacter edaphi]TLM95407.1 inorganic diphosphatase [Hymenobacter jeollabukensis]
MAHFNPWHDVNYGSKAPGIVNAIIEIPKGSKGKYELDKDSGLLKLDRVLFSAVHYPAAYGFIPQTYCDDKDPLDVLVLCSVDVVPMCLIEAKVIGVMQMIDNNEEDDKIIAVAANDVSMNHYNDISELPPHTLREMRKFFEDYKALENKQVVVEKFMGREDAYKIVQNSIDLYDETFRHPNNHQAQLSML